MFGVVDRSIKLVDVLGLEPRMYQCTDLQSAAFAARLQASIIGWRWRLELLQPGHNRRAASGQHILHIKHLRIQALIIGS